MGRIATLKILSETRDKLRALKRGGETYDDVLRRLLKEAEDSSNTSEKRSKEDL